MNTTAEPVTFTLDVAGAAALDGRWRPERLAPAPDGATSVTLPAYGEPALGGGPVIHPDLEFVDLEPQAWGELCHVVQRRRRETPWAYVLHDRGRVIATLPPRAAGLAPGDEVLTRSRPRRGSARPPAGSGLSSSIAPSCRP